MGYQVPLRRLHRQTAEGLGRPMDLPMAPVRLDYLCSPTCAHQDTSWAVVDSGSEADFWPAAALPPHVPWERLPRTSTKMASFLQRGIECRVWHCQVSVLGVAIAKQVYVIEPDAEAVKMPLLGRDSIFARFHVAFFLGSQPPFIDLVPTGQVTALPAPVYDGMAAATLPWWRNLELPDPEAVGALPSPASPAIVRPNREQRRLAARRSA